MLIQRRAETNDNNHNANDNNITLNEERIIQELLKRSSYRNPTSQQTFK